MRKKSKECYEQSVMESNETIDTSIDNSVAEAEVFTIINKLKELSDKIDFLERKLVSLEPISSHDTVLTDTSNVSSDLMGFQQYDVEQTIYSNDKKLNFLLCRIKFLTTEYAKSQYKLGNHGIYTGTITPIPNGINNNLIFIVCAEYPHEKNMYGGAFVVPRVKAYLKAGYDVKVCVSKGKCQSVVDISRKDGVEVYRGNEFLLEKMLIEHNPGCIVVHSPKLDSYNVFKKLDVLNRLILIFHGFEVRDVGHLWYNFEPSYFKQKAQVILREDIIRKQLAIDVFQNCSIPKVFVSNFFRNLVIDDVGVEIKNSHVIPNLIESDLFDYRPKTAEDRLKIFSIRPYDNNNYAADLIIQVILKLSKKSYFNKLSFHLQGFGKTFKLKTSVLKKFSNIKLLEGIITRSEISALHKDHGIALIPTRFDTQGVSLGEAMSSGLVVVTNNCTAIPEFVDSSCAILAAEDNVDEMVQGIDELYYNPELFLEKSKKAAAHIRDVAGIETTVNKEIELIENTIVYGEKRYE